MAKYKNQLFCSSKGTILLNFVKNKYFLHKGGFSSFRQFYVKNETPWSPVITVVLFSGFAILLVL